MGAARAALFSLWCVVWAVLRFYTDSLSTLPLTGGGEESHAATEAGKEGTTATESGKEGMEVKGKAQQKLGSKGKAQQRPGGEKEGQVIDWLIEPGSAGSQKRN